MREFTCIVCPNGCSLVYDEVKRVCTGNRCPRGAKYAEAECVNPTRTVCSSVRTTVKGYPVISVRTSVEIPKKLIPDLMKEINKAVVIKPLPIDSIVIPHVLGTKADLITTSPMLKEEK
ncbi:MAG: DUF1667 domain-containing protein [Bacilli bacterium]|jgi:CxxC motif-containing protein|nr:DUF1667 domain-containing protein [Bacilli bacterium]